MSEAPFTPPPGPSSQPAPSQPAPSQPASSEPAAIAAEAPSADTAAPTHSPRSALAVFSALGFLLLAGGLFYLWQEMQGLAQRPLVQPQPIVAGADPARVAALEDQVATLSRRLAELSGRPAPASPDLAPLAARIAALEQRPAPATADTAPLAATVAVLQNRLAADEAQAAAARARAARLRQAGLALAGGEPLGAIAGAPPALARFATAAPPTPARLRQEFPAVAAQALAASRPSTAGLSFAARMWQRVAGLVTVREGGHVLVGPPASVPLEAARTRLDAGDLAGAVAALDGLDKAAAAAMAPWRARAQALLDARAALAAMAAG